MTTPIGTVGCRKAAVLVAIFDTVGLAAFTLVGAKVALIAALAWYWMPICAALTCAGGGMLLDVVTGREPRTFLGEPYEEIAVFGSLLFYICLQVANYYEHSPWIVTASIIVTFCAVYAARMAVIRFGLRSYRLGDAMRRRRVPKRGER
jgi:NitT/TauT family transport system substrate-binding protein